MVLSMAARTSVARIGSPVWATRRDSDAPSSWRRLSADLQQGGLERGIRIAAGELALAVAEVDEQDAAPVGDLGHGEARHLAQRRLVVERPRQQRTALATNSSACSGVTTGPADEVSEPVIRCSAYQADRSRINIAMLLGVGGGGPEVVDLRRVRALRRCRETAHISTGSSPSLRCERGVRGATRTTDPASTRCTSSPRGIVKRPRVTR